MSYAVTLRLIYMFSPFSDKPDNFPLTPSDNIKFRHSNYTGLHIICQELNQKAPRPLEGKNVKPQT
jgi:hypothetical protein